MVAARRTDLETVIGWVDPDNGLEPNFSDLFGKFALHLGNDTALSASLLLARDEARYVEENGHVEEFWSTAGRRRDRADQHENRMVLPPVLRHDPLGWADRAGTQRVDRLLLPGRSRRRPGYFDGPGAAQQDWSLAVPDRHALAWGFDLRRGKATYDYAELQHDPRSDHDRR